MTVDQLKAMVVAERERKKDAKPAIQLSSSSGPVGFKLIEAIVATLETQQKQIDELKKAPGRAR